MKILLVMRQPYLEKVENLKYLINYFAGLHMQVNIVTAKDEHYLMPSFASKNVQCYLIDTSQKKDHYLHIPAWVRMLLAVFKIAIYEKPSVIIGADRFGTIISQLVAQFVGIPFIYYSLEYPVEKARLDRLNDKLEYRAIRKSALAITFDDVHAKFISQEVGTDISKFMLLPNSSGPRTRVGRSNLLRASLNLAADNVIVLHSGGFGPWFHSLELARKALSWPGHHRLVFHTSHLVEQTDYAKEFLKEIRDQRVILHAAPVPFSDLDDLIASADIGLAIYNTELLGYRADLLGLASGKIGRYLKNGLPIIVQRLSSFVPFVEKYGCGVCISHLAEIDDAITAIMSDYQNYSNNAIRCYDELWTPESHCAKIAQRLRILIDK